MGVLLLQHPCFAQENHRRRPDLCRWLCLELLAVSAGRYAYFFLEIFGKIIVIHKTGLDCDLLHAQGGVLQQLLCSMDSSLIQILVRCYAVSAAETANGL